MSLVHLTIFFEPLMRRKRVGVLKPHAPGGVSSVYLDNGGIIVRRRKGMT